MAHVPEVRIHEADPIRDLVHAELAEQDRTRLAQLADDGRVLARDPVLENAGSGRGTGALSREEVLHRNRDSMQRAAIPATGDLALGLRGLGSRELRRDRAKGVEGRLAR